MKEMTLREIQMFSMEILKVVHRFCVENDIKYSLSFGTLIGAIRHKGFVPWDDDLDIMMLRPDYDRFCRTFKAQGFEVVSRHTRKDCLISFARVCDTERTCVQSMEPWIREQGNLGLWIDIFPVDSVPDDYESFHKLWQELKVPHEKALKLRKSLRPFTKERPFKYNLNTLKKKFLSIFKPKPEYYLDRKESVVKGLKFGSTNHLAQLGYIGEEAYVEAQAMKEFILVPFEDTKFYVINGYDEFLTSRYGDYMQLPPEEQRVPQQDYIHFCWKDL